MAFVDQQEADERFRFQGGLNYCEICAGENGFAFEFSERPPETFSSFYDTQLFRPACFNCFSELTSSAARCDTT